MQLSEKESPVDDIQPDEDELIKHSSRKRLRIVDSDSDQENSSDNILESSSKRQNKKSFDSPFTSRKRIKSEDDTDKFKSSNDSPMDSTIETDEETNLKVKTSNSGSSFEEKLKSMQADESIIGIDIESTENDDDNILIENTDWKHNKLDFLKPKKIKDKNGKRPDDPDYDSTTLYVPTSYLDTLTPVRLTENILILKHFYDKIF